MRTLTALALFGLSTVAATEQSDLGTGDSPTIADIEQVKSRNVGHSGGKVFVRFDDGEEIPISLFRGTYGYSITGPLAKQYEALAQASNTRADIALALADALQTCQQAPTSQSEIDIKEMVFCEGVTSEQKAKANYWLAKAADLGEPIAALRYGELLGSEEGIRYLEASWLAGEGGALHSLAQMYREGRASPDRKPDFVQAYAHEYLFVKATDAWAGPIESRGPVRTRWIARAQAELQFLEPHLNATEKANAVAQAKAMLKANANCCLPM